MRPIPRICVVGSANVDLTFRTPRLPRPGETLAGLAFHLGMGGKGANQAVAAARLGAHVTFIARVGNDNFGQEAVARYRVDNINTAFIQQDGDRPTGTAAIIVDDAAENCIIVVAGANAGLSADDVRKATAAIEGADVLLCQLETPLEATHEALRLARAAGVRTMLTPAPARELPEELLRLCDFCAPNRTELELLAGGKIENQSDAESGAKVLRERGVGNVVVTMGGLGALLVGDGEAVHIPAIRVKAVDPTGAGDAFTAALAVSLAQGLTLLNAGRRASVVAGLTVTRMGAQSAFPTLAEVENTRPD